MKFLFNKASFSIIPFPLLKLGKSWCETEWPVNTDDNKDRRGENEAASSEHHEDFTDRVTCVPLYGQPPESLHGQNNIADDGVRQGEMEHQVVDIGAAPTLRSEQTDRISNSVFCKKQCLGNNLPDCLAAMTRAIPFSAIPTNVTVTVLC